MMPNFVDPPRAECRNCHGVIRAYVFADGDGTGWLHSRNGSRWCDGPTTVDGKRGSPTNETYVDWASDRVVSEAQR
jgi:hypothetical protein